MFREVSVPLNFPVCRLSQRNSVKLTAVGYSKHPMSCSNAEYPLFTCFSAIYRTSINLQRLDSRSRLLSKQPLSVGNQRQILSESLG